MRLDHIAFRVVDRFKAAEFFTKAPFNYTIQTEFEIPELCTKCLALVPSEKTRPDAPFHRYLWDSLEESGITAYHMAPEIFISSSEDPKSPVGQWVAARSGIGGVHHLAYNVDHVAEKMAELQSQGWQFTTEAPIVDGDLTQCFTKPVDVIGGVIIELINRPTTRGFSVKNVKDLMKSTDGMK